MALIDELYAIIPDENGWRKTSSGLYVKLGYGVKLGNYVTLALIALVIHYVRLWGAPW